MRLYLRTEQQEEKALREVASGISVEDNAKKIIIIKGKTFECAERRENDWENYPAKGEMSWTVLVSFSNALLLDAATLISFK